MDTGWDYRREVDPCWMSSDVGMLLSGAILTIWLIWQKQSACWPKRPCPARSKRAVYLFTEETAAFPPVKTCPMRVTHTDRRAISMLKASSASQHQAGAQSAAQVLFPPVDRDRTNCPRPDRRARRHQP